MRTLEIIGILWLLLLIAIPLGTYRANPNPRPEDE